MKRPLPEEYVPLFTLPDYTGILHVKQLEPKNLNMYVLHLAEKSKLPESTFLILDQKKRIPLLKRKYTKMHYYDHEYWVFETHSLRVEPESCKILDIFIELDESDEFAPKFDMTLFWTKQFHHRFVSLNFFPPDLNLEQLGLVLNLQTIPPKTSIALKQRGDVSGNKASTLAGFWVPTKKEDPTWSYDKPKTFTQEQKKRVSNGQKYEETAILFYICMFQQVIYQQIGWCKAPAPLPLNWGALPDGYLIDPGATVPDQIQSWYPTLDPTRGVLEVKYTDKNLTFEPYFYPQIYMEMISAQVMWCDVIRFKKSLTKTTKNKWKTEYNARVYRIYRHRPTEFALISLLKYALKHKETLQTLVHEDEKFLSFRAFLGELASYEPFKALGGTERFSELMGEYENYKKQIY